MSDNTNVEYITEVAIIDDDGSILHEPAPSRHHDLIRKSKYKPGNPCFQIYQGFLTSTGRFCDRVEAYQIAVAAGQINPKAPRPRPGHKLFSEDLW